jgi:HK97 family phage major capsid protein
MGMVEVKADALEQSFEQFEQEGDEAVAALKVELETLKAKIASCVIAAQRPVLDGVKSAEASSFVHQNIRRGIESGLETKALGSSTDAIGGYAVPEEIDRVIDETLVAISPIRAIANVVKVGSAGYRKLIASGGTPSGWVGFEAARPESATPGFTEIVPASAGARDCDRVRAGRGQGLHQRDGRDAAARLSHFAQCGDGG